MYKSFRIALAALLLLALALGTFAASAECAHANKKQVTVPQDPVYTSLGASGHRVTTDTMIYWACTSCNMLFSGKPGDSTTATEAHDMKDGVCTKCGYTIPNQVLAKRGGNGTVTMNVGEQLQLQPAFAATYGYTVKGYKSSRTKVATVTSTGLVTALAEGKTKITVTTNKKKATVTIKVVDPYKCTGVKIAQGKKATLNIDATLKLTAQLQPVTARTTLTWKSSRPQVATVDQNGLVTPHAEGTAKITVTSANKKRATFTVKVVDPYKPKRVAIAQGKSATVLIDQKLSLNAVLTPADARTTLTWKSSRTRVATVDANGLVTPHAQGTAKITVTTKNKKRATITVTVIDPSIPTGVTLDQGKVITLKVGQTQQLTATLAPSTAKSTFLWYAGRARYAKVDPNGLVTAIKVGTGKVTVQTANGKKATITVKVVP